MVATARSVLIRLGVGIAIIILGMPVIDVVRAEEGKTALKIRPSIDQIVAKPGEKISRKVILNNLSGLPLPIKSYTRSFVATDEGGGSDYPDDPGSASNAVQTWFKVGTPDFIIQPGAEREVDILINVPNDAAPGGHYATLFFESLVPRELLSEHSLYLATRIGVLYFFVVAGDIHEKGSVESFTTPNVIYQQSPVEFTIRFNNTGNIHLQPTSKITILNWKGDQVAVLSDPGKTTLPQKIRGWSIEWNQERLFGRYTARLETVTSPDGKKETKELVFWFVPITLLAGIIGLVALLVIIMRIGKKRFRQAYLVLRGRE